MFVDQQFAGEPDDLHGIRMGRAQRINTGLRALRRAGRELQRGDLFVGRDEERSFRRGEEIFQRQAGMGQ